MPRADQLSPFSPMSQQALRNPTISHDEDPGEETVVRTIPKDLQPTPVERDRMYLLVIAGAFTGQMFHLENRHTTIGRSSRCDIILRDNDISRVHIELEMLADNTVLMTDKSSTNGTYVNGLRLQQAVLEDGDRIQLGLSTILKLSLHDELEEQLQRRLYENAILDGLTQLHNRKFFDDQFHTEFSFAKRHQTSLSVLLMDVDHFKNVNDTYGHPVGDRVLQMVSATLKKAIRTEDLVARYGGEEFVIIARGILPTQAAILGERIRSGVERIEIPLQGGQSMGVTISIGIVTMHTQQFESTADFLQEADERLYMAKRNGRNQVVAERSNW